MIRIRLLQIGLVVVPLVAIVLLFQSLGHKRFDSFRVGPGQHRRHDRVACDQLRVFQPVLDSRQEAGEILRSSGARVIEFRASIVIGS